jgi:tRNA A-37 threonylcarbamoyl transferase component Bud32
VALLDSRYQLLECVGSGGTAEVYRAEDMLLGRTVAIKLIRPDADVLASPQRVHREVSALASLNHHSLVTLLDASIDGGPSRYLVMEFVDGPTLAAVLRDGPLPAAQVSHLAVELATALQVVHQAKLVHRDVKPSNILLAPSSMPAVCFDVKLADFGLVQLTDAPRVTTPGLMLGTGAYLAPEQVRGEPSGPAADIYALGLVLLEALTGERAFPHASGIGAVMARLLDPPVIPEDLDPRWSELIRSMTADEPDARPTALDVSEAVARMPVDIPSPTVATLAPGLAPAAPAVPDAAPTVAGAVVVPPRTPVRRLRAALTHRPLMALAYLASAALACLFIVGGGIAMQAAGEATADGSTPIFPSAVPSGLPTTWASDPAAVPAVAGDTRMPDSDPATSGAPAAVPVVTDKKQGDVGKAAASTHGAANSQRAPQHGPKAGK